MDTIGSSFIHVSRETLDFTMVTRALKKASFGGISSISSFEIETSF
jgi:hypothetical protein